ncbi:MULTISPECIES: ABC transporter substrate binding protein [Vibrio]|nr:MULTISPECIES: ABC transporter substrate binding protein [Vibrio]MBF9000858.1 EAL domain-containing protein [Vibrio nitrifigilis]
MAKINLGLTEGFGDQSPDIDIEYMDSKRLINQRSIELFYQFLSYKLEHRPPYDLVITSDDNALQFAMQFRQQLFPNIPIVFLGLNNQDLAQQLVQNHDANITGTVEAVSINDNLALISKLRPSIKNLYLITDGTTTGQADLNNALSYREQFPNFSLKILDLSRLTWKELSEKLNVADDTDAALLLSAFNDKNKVNLTFNESLKLIVSASKVPVFHLYDQGIGKGLVGGVLVTHQEHGRLAALQATRILEGTPVKQIPIVLKSPNIPIFDERILNKFNIDESLLPPNSHIRYKIRNNSLLYVYWQELLGIAIIIGLLIALVIVLAHQNRVKRRHNIELGESQTRLNIILDNIDAYIYMKDAKSRYLYANKAFCRTAELELRDIMMKTPTELYDTDMAFAFTKADNQVFETKKPYRQEECYWVEKHQTYKYIKTTKIPLINQVGELYGLCGISFDITSEKNHQKQLKHIANFDQLTDLPNRLLFLDRLQQSMSSVDKNGGRITVMYFDLDNFKYINDRFGAAFGDSVLKIIANRINESLSSDDTLSRPSGDEFILLLHHLESPEQELSLVHQISALINQPVQHNGHTLSITASFGITSYPQRQPIEADKLIRQADQAMYYAKSRSTENFHFFDSNAEDAALQLEEMIIDVQTGLNNQEFELFYQPKVDLINGDIIGMEALIRWRHRNKGLLAPGLFLPQIERHNIMLAIDEWVISDAVRQIYQWSQQGIEIPVSINLSHLYFNRDDFVDAIAQQLKSYPDVNLALLELEIVETQELSDLHAIAEKITQCQSLGVRFSLDDFGTGFSSMTYLKQLPVNQIKVDSSFVIDMLDDQEDRMILQGIHALAHAFNIDVIAEGMESHQHRRELLEIGYRYAQGYGIAKPMPMKEMEQWINQWTMPAEWNNDA